MSETCKRCGNNKFYEGRLSNYATVLPIDGIFSHGSKIKVSFCSKCGEISSMIVENYTNFENKFEILY